MSAHVVDIDALNRLADRISERYCRVNEGGCAVVAYLVHEKLMGVATNLRTVFFGVNGTNRLPIDEVVNKNANYTLHDLNHSGYHCDHAVVLFDVDGITYAFDTDEGAIPFDEYCKNTLWSDRPYIEMPFEVVRQVAEIDVGWNSLFRRKQIPRMKIAIKNSRLVK